MYIPDPTFFHPKIPDPNCLHPGSRIRIKEFKNFNPKKPKKLFLKKPKKWFLSSRKYDPGCSSRIRMLTFYPSRIPDPGVKKAPDPGSGSATLHIMLVFLGRESKWGPTFRQVGALKTDYTVRYAT
jgi:hypothetical protein